MASPTEYDRVATELVDLIRQYPHFDDRESIFNFLDRHLAYINLPLLDALAKFFKVSPSVDFADLYLRMGNRLDAFSLDNRVRKLEIVIGIYKLALEVHTKQSSPAKWAMTQYLLACKYSDRIKGGKAENIDASIYHYQNALEVYTKQDFSIDWANIQYNLGVKYINRTKGNKIENIERAIHHYKSAREVYTQQEFSQNSTLIQEAIGGIYSDWINGWIKRDRIAYIEIEIHYYKSAMEVCTQQDSLLESANIQYNLGNAYLLRIRGDKSENIELSIQYFRAALAIYKQQDFSVESALTQFSLGCRYNERINGHKAENIELSIEYYKSALVVYTYQYLPIGWAEIQNNLGLAYYHRIKGDKAENIELSIEYSKSALAVYTYQDFSINWAMIHNNLGVAYIGRIKGDKAENIELSIEYYKSALVVYTYQDFSIDWAKIQNNLGIAYDDRIKGDKAENIELSIEYSKSALAVYTYQDFSINWAMIHNNLGVAYIGRIKGDKAENIELSIEYSKSALVVYTRQDFSIDWAKIQLNLGVAYDDRIKRDKAENIELSIEYSKSALAVYTRQDFPIDWAMIHNNLGVAYIGRIKGDKAENIELSIEYSKSALAVYTRQDFPIDWTKIQLNLGLAYHSRIKGDKAENIELSIEYSKSALAVYTYQDFSIKWALTQNNLGLAYHSRIKGDKAENIELSIEYSKSALAVYTYQDFPIDWAMIYHNLSIYYNNRIKGDKAENIELSIEYSKSALAVYTYQDFPIGWTQIQNNLGIAYDNRIKGDKAENLRFSIESFTSALEINTPEHLPIQSLLTARNLGTLYFNQGNWQEALSVYEIAMQAAETSRSWSVNDHERQRILTEALSVYENAIQCAVNLKDYKRAIEYTERVRSRQLVELIASKDLYSDAQVPAEIQAYLTEYQQLNQEVDNLRDSGEDRSGTTKTRRTSQDFRKSSEKIAKAEERKQILYNQIRTYDPVLAGQIAVAPISHSEIQQLITSPHTAILTFYSTNNDTHIFILKHDREPELFTCKNQGKQELLPWLIANWRDPYQDNTAQWLTKMPEVLAEIATRLELPQLVANHLSDIQELVLVPHLILHQIPFAALPILGSEQLLGEKFTIRCIPSCQILQYCQQRPPINTNIQGIVEDADDSLMGARYEGQKIAEIYRVQDSDRLRGKTQATVANYRQLLGRVNRLHSSHHASFKPHKPLESALFLADGKITLGDLLLGERYQNLDEIFLSACETHVGEYTFTDDVTTITTGFLCIGARSVQSTLWSVDDLVTAIFDVFYHQERREGFNRAVSLKRAQVRLRYLSGEEFRINHYPELKQFLAKFLPSELDKIDQKIDRLEIAKKTAIGDDKEEISREIKQLEIRYRYLDKQLKPLLNDYCQQAYPFAAPFYWAGFICQGMA